MPAAAQTVHLVDASPYVFRAFFSLPSTLRDGRGRPVGAVYGFAAFLIRLIAEEAPTHLGVAFDHSLTTSFRNDLYPEYKAGREPPPPELVAQLGDCRRVAAALGAATYRVERYEADDLIATLVAGLLAAGHGAVVVSSDKDLCQLVGPGVELLDFARGRRFDAAAVERKFGVRPAQLADLLALAGDGVDNIPGVAGVGPKTAAALLERFASLEAIYERLDGVAELPIRGAAGVRRRLESGREAAALSKRLATVAADAPVAADLDELRLRGADPEAVDRLFAELGFRGLRERIGRWRRPQSQEGSGSPSREVRRR